LNIGIFVPFRMVLVMRGEAGSFQAYLDEGSPDKSPDAVVGKTDHVFFSP
jgi:hypothetical protein